MEKDIHYKKLSELSNSEVGVITRVLSHGSFRKRITEMGFVRGKMVRVIKNAPLMDPVEYEIMGYRVALRRSEAEMIRVTNIADFKEIEAEGSIEPKNYTFDDESVNRFLHETGNVINVALVGNPNCGKTSLFNVVSGLNEHVGNYSGVTVSAKTANFSQDGYTINISDLPGTYSITEYTPEELYVRAHILENMPDVVVNVVDASNLERNLFLTTQLIDMNLKVVIALNMYDELSESGAQFDYVSLGEMIGIPIIPTIASKGIGTKELFKKVIDVFEDNESVVRHIHINYGTDLERGILLLQNEIWKNTDIVVRYSSRYLAIKLLEGDTHTAQLLSQCSNYQEIADTTKTERAHIEKSFGDRPETIIANAKYGFIAGALGETFVGGKGDKHKRTGDIDRLLTHKWFGFPLFMIIMWIVFQATFSLGAYPADWIESGIGWISNLINQTMSEGPLKELILGGILSGVGGVIVFLPNILLLFLFISFMEDTGYMARASFIMDKLMHKIGLHGKSFIPLLMGLGCNVPAIMATRTLESKKDRLITMMIIPFISCSARLPVYVLLISAFFPRNGGLVLFSIYALGIVIAILSSLALKKIFFKQDEAPFVMELPPYRIPTGRSVVRHMWSKGAQYLRKMGSVILIASVIIWALGHYPTGDKSMTNAERQENSYIGKIGKAIEPVIRPLGFDWQIGVSLITGFAAKEIVVSTMSVLAGADEDNEMSLQENLKNRTHISGINIGEPVFNPIVAYGLMVFILIYFPCIATIAAIRREAGLRWAVFTMVYTTVLAWVCSLAVYQIGSLII